MTHPLNRSYSCTGLWFLGAYLHIELRTESQSQVVNQCLWRGTLMAGVRWRSYGCPRVIRAPSGHINIRWDHRFPPSEEALRFRCHLFNLRPETQVIMMECRLAYCNGRFGGTVLLQSLWELNRAAVGSRKEHWGRSFEVETPVWGIMWLWLDFR